MFNTSQGFVNGEWINSLSGNTFKVVNPFNNEEIETVTDFGAKDVEKAIDNAHDTFKTWRKSTLKERSKFLRKIGDLMLEKKEVLGQLLTSEQGKPLAEATGEVAFAASFFHFYSEECKRPEGEVISASAPNKQFLTVREPLGVATMVCPWNFPIGMPARKIAAALAAGCTCVVKPAEDTPLCTLALANLIQQSGLPAGVVNIVPCSRNNVAEVGSMMCISPKVAILSFTGSTEVGKYLYGQCSDTVKRVALELGGNAPFIVFPTADVDAAVQGLMAAKFRNSGQTCVTANRIMVHSSIYQDFVNKFKLETQKLQVGDGSKCGTTQGPIINSKQLSRIERIVMESVSQGAVLELGGETLGNCYLPTILTRVKNTMTCWKEEIFGPVAAIASFDTEEEAVAEANNTDRGLAGFFYSKDYSQMWRVSRELEFGMIGVNDVGISTPETPFGGYKTSGIGKEGTKMGLDEYSNVKLIDMGGL